METTGRYTDERTLLQGSFKGIGLDPPGAGRRPMIEFYEHCSETSDYMKCGIFLHYLRNFQSLTNDSVM